jgi:hypothetical protein
MLFWRFSDCELSFYSLCIDYFSPFSRLLVHFSLFDVRVGTSDALFARRRAGIAA